MTVLIPLPKFRAVDSNGFALSGGKVFVYAAGTTTKIDSYTDAGGGTTNVNPVILDSRGEANIWMPASVPFKIVLAPSTDTDPPTNAIWTVDNIQAGGASPVVSDTAPASPSFGLLWLDTLANPSTLYIFDNVAWVPLLDLDETNHNSSSGRGIAYGTLNGSVAVQTITVPIRTSLRIGQQFMAKVSVPPTGPLTLAINGGSPLSVLSNSGGQIAHGDWPSNSIRHLVVSRTGVAQDVTQTPGFLVNRKATVFALTTGFGNSIPNDNTIPQITEGDQIFALSFVPQSPNNQLEFEISVHGANSTVGALIMALFQDSGANAISGSVNGTAANVKAIGLLKHQMGAPGAGVAFSFSVRMGTAGGTFYVNAGASGTRELGGVQLATFSINEYRPTLSGT